MTLWRSPVHSDLPLIDVWRALGPLTGVSHRLQGDEWIVEVDRLERRRDHYVKSRVLTVRSHDELDAVVQAVQLLPGLPVRLALIAALMGLTC